MGDEKKLEGYFMEKNNLLRAGRITLLQNEIDLLHEAGKKLLKPEFENADSVIRHAEIDWIAVQDVHKQISLIKALLWYIEDKDKYPTENREDKGE